MDEDDLRRSTEYQDTATVFSGTFRVGAVTDVDNERRLARVRFADLGYTSDWLPVLFNRDTVPGETFSVRPYMPEKGEQVLCIYEPVRGGRGYVLGGIAPWA